VSGEAAVAAGAADSSTNPSIDAMIPKRAMRDRLSTALDTTDTSHLLQDLDQDWRLLGDSRSHALPRAPTARSLTRRQGSNQPTFGEETAIIAENRSARTFGDLTDRPKRTILHE
jgi:hypothetical protein